MSFDKLHTVEVDRLGVRYPGRIQPALRDLTATIRSGETLAITGPSGCGKTTLLRALAGFIPGMIDAEVHGHVRFNGHRREQSDSARLSAAIGLVQQDPDAQICTLKVWSEVAFGPENLCLPRDVVRARVTAALDAVGIAHLAERDTPTLSGGEKQRLAIAAILAMEPSMILLDEPTAHLDPLGAGGLFNLLREMQQASDTTLVLVEHRLGPIASLRPEIWVMDQGRLVERRSTRLREDFAQEWSRLSNQLTGPGKPINPTRSLALDSVSFGYEHPLIENLSLTLNSGHILGIIGPNGCGKTTLLRLLAGLIKPDAGSMKGRRELTASMVFQHPHQQVFERTVRRDLEIEGQITDAELRRLLSTSQLEGMADVPPHSLSLGEQRRLTVLSAWRTMPDLLLLDEPFIGQDRDNVSWILARIADAKRNGAIVCLVTHDIGMAQLMCDRVLFLGDRPMHGPSGEIFGALADAGWDAFTPGYWKEMSS